jgi:hypothetical protein
MCELPVWGAVDSVGSVSGMEQRIKESKARQKEISKDCLGAAYFGTYCFRGS